MEGLAQAFAWAKVHYHKDWVDVGTFGIAAIYGIYRARRKHFRMKPIQFGLHMMHGSAVFPLILLSLAVLWRGSIDALLSSNRVTLSMAGVFALISVMSEDDDSST